MANGKSGTLTWTSGNYSVRVTWSETYEVSTNKSKVSITKVEAKTSSWYGVTYYPDGKIYINGTCVLTMNSVLPTGSVYIQSLNKWYEISNATCSKSDISHNSDGTKSISIQLAGNRFSNFSFYTVNGDYGNGWGVSGKKTITLQTIPRASSISSAADKTLGESCSISWTPYSSSFKYKLKFSLGGWNYTTTDYISPKTTSSYTYEGYNLPLDVAKQIPNNTKGTMTVYLYTYNGSTQIGSTANRTFTVTIPKSIKPSISSVTATLVNSNAVIDDWGIAVAGYTKVKIVASASGSYNSTISSFTISGGYSTTESGTSLNYTGGVISSSGNKNFTVVAKDSRGRSSDSKSTTAITFYPYSKPTVSSFAVERSSSDAKKIVVKANWTFSSVNGNNSTIANLYYKKSSNSNWIPYGAIAKNTSITLENEFEETSSYNFKIIIEDALGETATDDAFISTINVLMDFRAGGKGLGIGKIAESDNLEVAFDTIFMGDVYIQDANGTKITLADYIRSLIT